MSSSPLETPTSPASAGSVTSCPGRSFRSPAGIFSSSKTRIMPPGELDNSARTVERHGGIDVGHDLFGGEPVLGVVDYGVGGHTGTLHDKGAANDAGAAFNVR